MLKLKKHTVSLIVIITFFSLLLVWVWLSYDQELQHIDTQIKKLDLDVLK